MPKINTYMLSDDYTHLEDKAMKSAAQFFGEEMLQWAGIHEKLRQVMPTTHSSGSQGSISGFQL